MAKAEYRNAIRSRKMIKAALADLLQEKPLDKITVTDVVNRADINRGTFYTHYSDINDVIRSLIEETFSKIKNALTGIELQQVDLPNRLLSQIELILDEDLEFYRKVMTSSAAPLMQEQLIRVVVDFLLKQETATQNMDPLNLLLTIRFCAGGLSVLYKDWFDGKLPISLSQLTKEASSMLQSVIQSHLS